MKERPIIFNSEMVRAILDDRKTQTRRVLKVQPNVKQYPEHEFRFDKSMSNDFVLMMRRDSFWGNTGIPFKSPYGHPGDRIWVREKWFNQKEAHEKNKLLVSKWSYGKSSLAESQYPDIMYAADYIGKKMLCKWRPSIHMPRWASRITLEITSVRVERLQDISEEDCKREGIFIKSLANYQRKNNLSYWRIWRHAFKNLWNSIAKPGNKWEDNPWVWVIEFKRINP